MTLRVLVVSAVRVVREALHSLLARQAQVDVVATVDLQQATDQSAQLNPDIILFDAGRHGSVGFVENLVASAPRSKVVAFGVKETDEEVLALAAAGTAGYIRENVTSGDIIRALELVASDELTCSPRATALLYRRVGALSQRDHNSLENDSCTEALPLSRRELQIARLMDCGLANKAIARRLGIETATVKNHIHNICRKLNVHRRGEASARLRAMVSEHAWPPVAALESIPAPYGAGDQNPAARSGSQAGHPWSGMGTAAMGQLVEGVAIPSAPSELKSPIAKL